MKSEQLKGLLRKLRKPPTKGLDLAPTTPFDALLEERLKGLERQVEELKGRVNGLIFLVVGAVVAQVVLGFFR